MNNVVLIGRLTKDVELRQAASKGVASFTLAVDRGYKNAQTGQSEADFVPIVVWDKQGENCAKYLRKGMLCAVQGRIQTRSYEDKDGKRVYVTEVVAERVQFLEKAQQEFQKQQQPFQQFTDDGGDVPF